MNIAQDTVFEKKTLKWVCENDRKPLMRVKESRMEMNPRGMWRVSRETANTGNVQQISHQLRFTFQKISFAWSTRLPTTHETLRSVHRIIFLMGQNYSNVIGLKTTTFHPKGSLVRHLFSTSSQLFEIKTYLSLLARPKCNALSFSCRTGWTQLTSRASSIAPSRLWRRDRAGTLPCGHKTSARIGVDLSDSTSAKWWKHLDAMAMNHWTGNKHC